MSLKVVDMLKNLKILPIIKHFRCGYNYLCGSLNYYIDKKNVRAMATKEMPLVDIKDMAVYTGLSLIMKGMSVSPLKLQKILYYEQSWHMVFFGRENTLFEDIPQAWVNGPVYPKIYHEYKGKVTLMSDNLSASDFYSGNIEDRLKSLIAMFGWNKEQIECIDSVITLYGAKTQDQLVMMTHIEDPWCEKRGDLLPFERSNEYMSLDSMHDYYKARYTRNRQQ